MSQDAISIITFLPSMIWQLFTGFKIPGLNFTPAVLFFGILSFGLAFRFLMGILNISTSGFTAYKAREANRERLAEKIRARNNYRRN